MTSRSSSGRDAHRYFGKPNPRRPDDHHWGSSGAPSNPAPGKTVGGVLTTQGRGEGSIKQRSMAEDEYSRSTIMTSASVRHDHYSDRPRSEATGGPLPGKSRKPVPYQDY
jgi:hypothetical protein